MFAAFEWYQPKELTMLDIKEIAEECAQKLTDSVSMEEMETFFYDEQTKYFNSLSLDELLQQARDLNIDLGEWDVHDVA
jgi:hypothetical protein